MESPNAVTSQALEDRITKARAERETHLVAKNFVEASRWDGRLDILKEWLASLRATVAVLLAVLLAAPSLQATEIRDCSVPPLGLPLVVDTGVADLHPAAAAVSAIAPVGAGGATVPWGQGGKIGSLCGAMSNGQQMCGRFIEQLRTSLKRKNAQGNLVLAPEWAILPEVAQSGAATREWLNPAFDGWTKMDATIARAGLTRAQIQIIVWPFAVKDGWRFGPQTAGEVAALVQMFKTRFPTLRLVIATDLPLTTTWMRNVDAAGDDLPTPGPHPTQAELVGDGYLLQWLAETHAGLPAGVFFRFLPMTVDGGTGPDIRTASRSWPAGLDVPCVFIQPDGVHLVTKGQSGAWLAGVNLAERVLDLPVLHQMWRQQP